MKSAIAQATLTDSQALRLKICDSHLTCKVANESYLTSANELYQNNELKK